LEIHDYKSIFLDYLTERTTTGKSLEEPKNLYDPIHYILQIGGKRIRPMLTLMSCELFGGKLQDALPAALTVEMFHNFTLIHDDIMDKASLRRGKKTVHIKWNQNIGILSGDALMILSYQMLETYSPDIFKKLHILFNKTALQICEGQQYDIDFETRNDVALPEYVKMISFKTAVLLGCALQMGAIIADANDKDTQEIYKFGLNLGIAFQLQDDYLDAFGTDAFGKKVGGDIIENKKTFLYLKTLELASQKDAGCLLKWYGKTEDTDQKIREVKALFSKYKVPELLLQEIENYSNIAFNNLEQLSLSDKNKQVFIEFGKSLMVRII
jgi:geranylgeranyl diphosphate synthase type II